MTNNTYQQLDHNQAIAKVETALKQAGVNYTTHYQTLSVNKLAVHFRFADYSLHGMGGLTPQITVINSTDKTRAFKLIGGVFRLICSNGLVAGEVFDQERIIHRVGKTFDHKWNSLPQRIVAMIDNIVLACQEFEELQNHTLTEEQMVTITANIRMGKKAKQKAIEDIVFQDQRREADSQNNVWTLYNIINENLRKHSITTAAYARNNNQLLENIQLLAA